MSLVFAGICSHAPGITGRAHLADPRHRARSSMAPIAAWRDDLAAARPDALIVVAAEHFANFFMNNMPAFAMGMADSYEGPIEDPAVAGYSAHRRSGQCAAVAAADPRNDADRGSRLRRGMEVRSRHHGAFELPDAAASICRSSR